MYGSPVSHNSNSSPQHTPSDPSTPSTTIAFLSPERDAQLVSPISSIGSPPALVPLQGRRRVNPAQPPLPPPTPLPSPTSSPDRRSLNGRVSPLSSDGVSYSDDELSPHRIRARAPRQSNELREDLRRASPSFLRVTDLTLSPLAQPSHSSSPVVPNPLPFLDESVVPVRPSRFVFGSSSQQPTHPTSPGLTNPPPFLHESGMRVNRSIFSSSSPQPTHSTSPRPPEENSQAQGSRRTADSHKRKFHFWEPPPNLD